MPENMELADLAEPQPGAAETAGSRTPRDLEAVYDIPVTVSASVAIVPVCAMLPPDVSTVRLPPTELDTPPTSPSVVVTVFLRLALAPVPVVFNAIAPVSAFDPLVSVTVPPVAVSVNDDVPVTVSASAAVVPVCAMFPPDARTVRLPPTDVDTPFA